MFRCLTKRNTVCLKQNKTNKNLIGCLIIFLWKQKKFNSIQHLSGQSVKKFFRLKMICACPDAFPYSGISRDIPYSGISWIDEPQCDISDLSYFTKKRPNTSKYRAYLEDFLIALQPFQTVSGAKIFSSANHGGRQVLGILVTTYF